MSFLLTESYEKDSKSEIIPENSRDNLIDQLYEEKLSCNDYDAFEEEPEDYDYIDDKELRKLKKQLKKQQKKGKEHSRDIEKRLSDLESKMNILDKKVEKVDAISQKVDLVYDVLGRVIISGRASQNNIYSDYQLKGGWYNEQLT